MCLEILRFSILYIWYIDTSQLRRLDTFHPSYTSSYPLISSPSFPTHSSLYSLNLGICFPSFTHSYPLLSSPSLPTHSSPYTSILDIFLLTFLPTHSLAPVTLLPYTPSSPLSTPLTPSVSPYLFSYLKEIHGRRNAREIGQGSD
ncbi:hypothetical protein E2C01_029785 [Portunus trituberculatus]|uniref:Uncharacterized protein n=1 Tax=Portunus trituberculatus TaxID=210409 RepID=A0A5B7ENT5_PORTR|nr:hypothetical protein [Portunus trituberculatus]